MEMCVRFALRLGMTTGIGDASYQLQRLPGFEEALSGEGAVSERQRATLAAQTSCKPKATPGRIPNAIGSKSLLKLAYGLRHQEPREMILFLLFQRRVLFQSWLHRWFRLWFAKILFETCCDIGF